MIKPLMTLAELKTAINSQNYSTEDWLGDLKSGDSTTITEARTGKKTKVQIKNIGVNDKRIGGVEVSSRDNGKGQISYKILKKGQVVEEGVAKTEDEIEKKAEKFRNSSFSNGRARGLITIQNKLEKVGIRLSNAGPSVITHKGEGYYPTGKEGKRIKDGIKTREFSTRVDTSDKNHRVEKDARLWLGQDGKIEED